MRKKIININQELAFDGNLPLSLGLVSDIDDYELEEMTESIFSWILNAYFTYAYIIIDHERYDNNIFYRNIEMVVPDKFSIVRQDRFVVEANRGVVMVNHTLTSREAIDQTVLWIREVIAKVRAICYSYIT
jgi:hypothetical protein